MDLGKFETCADSQGDYVYFVRDLKLIVKGVRISEIYWFHLDLQVKRCNLSKMEPLKTTTLQINVILISTF